MKNFTFKKLILVFIITSMFLLSCGGKTDTIVVASKNFTENIILAEMMAQVIEHNTDIEVTRKLNMGSTFIVFSALKSGDVDMYPDYTGTLYQANLKQTNRVSAAETYTYVKREMAKQNVSVMGDFGFNNTYAIGLMQEVAQPRGLKKISDLINHPDLIPGFDNEFIQRKDGASEMFKYYGLKFDNDMVQMEIGLKLIALANGDIEFTDAFSTDSKLLRYNITILEDDLNFFPPYYAVPVVRTETLEKYPKIQNALDTLSKTIQEDEMMQLNYAVEDDKKSVKTVAKNFLESKKIL